LKLVTIDLSIVGKRLGTLIEGDQNGVAKQIKALLG
jgi:hypothetical protein